MVVEEDIADGGVNSKVEIPIVYAKWTLGEPETEGGKRCDADKQYGRGQPFVFWQKKDEQYSQQEYDAGEHPLINNHILKFL